LHEIAAGISIAQAAHIHDLHPETIRSWRKMERKYGERSFAGNGARTRTRLAAQLERTLGQVTLEKRAFKKSIKLTQGARSKKRRAAMIAIARDFDGSFPTTALASILEISRSSLYRGADVDRDVGLRDAIYAITMDWPRYGYRTIDRVPGGGV